MADHPISGSAFGVDNPGKEQDSAVLEKIRAINQIQRRLGLFGVMAPLGTFVNFGVSLLWLGRMLVWAVPLSLSAAALALVTVLTHEHLRKAGDALFEEISDEFQRRFKSSDPTGEYSEARKALRAFSATTDLPLIPGKWGPVIYVLANLLPLVIESLPRVRQLLQ
jgi:hypothetical protein